MLPESLLRLVELTNHLVNIGPGTLVRIFKIYFLLPWNYRLYYLQTDQQTHRHDQKENRKKKHRDTRSQTSEEKK